MKLQQQEIHDSSSSWYVAESTKKTIPFTVFLNEDNADEIMEVLGLTPLGEGDDDTEDEDDEWGVNHSGGSKKQAGT